MIRIRIDGVENVTRIGEGVRRGLSSILFNIEEAIKGSEW